MLVAKGANSDTRKVLCFGMWSDGKGPDAANDVKLRAVMTGQRTMIRDTQGALFARFTHYSGQQLREWHPRRSCDQVGK